MKGYLVDTSVLIDFFRGRENPPSLLFEEILKKDLPFALPIFTYQELLQGSRDEREYQTLHDYLVTQPLLYPDHETFEEAARLFYRARKQGITLRSSIDALIAVTAIQHELILLHNDRDFRHIATLVPLVTAP